MALRNWYFDGRLFILAADFERFRSDVEDLVDADFVFRQVLEDFVHARLAELKGRLVQVDAGVLEDVHNAMREEFVVEKIFDKVVRGAEKLQHLMVVRVIKFRIHREENRKASRVPSE